MKCSRVLAFQPVRTRMFFLVMLALAAMLVACGGETSPQAITDGRSIYADRCSACHGSSGRGGVGPDLSTVTEVWRSCSEQIEWVTLGSIEWQETYGDTYGATNRPLIGGMPGHRELLTATEIASVVAFERVTYGGGDRASVLEDCGLPST